MSSDDIALRVQNVSKCFEMYAKPVHRLLQTLTMGKKTFYKEFWALKDINFEVKRGECVGIIGRNGAGKSTLLQIIAGTLQPTTGSVEIKGRVAALLELGSGFNPEFTGRDNVYMNATILGLTKAEIDAKYDEIVAFADIGEFIDQPVKTYSSGMMVRLAFSVQVVINPEVLIIDEALAVGDMFFQQKCFLKLKQLQENGCTSLFVSHDISSIKNLCSMVVYLKGGRMNCIGSPVEICTAYQNDTTVISANGIMLKQNISQVTGFDNADSVISGKHKFRIDGELTKRISARSGSLDIEAVALDVYNEAGNIIFDISSDQIVRVVLSLIARNEVPAGAYAGLLCRDEKSNDIFAINTDVWGVYLPALFKDECCTVEWKFRIPLNLGKYFFSFGVKPNVCEDYFYDRVFNAAMLNVYAADNLTFRVGGCLYIKPLGISINPFIPGEN